MKTYKNIIIAVVVVILGGAVIALALNGGMSQGQSGGQNMDGMGGGDQMVQGDPFSEKNPVAGNELKFSAKDVDGNDVDESIFKENKLTIINLWGTFCPPCIEEMPSIQKIQDEYKDKVKVIGLLVDSTEKTDDVKEVLKEKNITYTNIIANQKLCDDLVLKFGYVPVTLFVDSEGKIIEQYIAGDATYDMLKQHVDELLAE